MEPWLIGPKNYHKTIMGFQKGNKLSRGGKKGNKGGRPSNEEKKGKLDAEKIATEFIEKRIKPVLETYGKVAKGYWVKHKETKKDGTIHEWKEFVFDASVLRHFIDKVKPARLPEDKKGHAIPSMTYTHPKLEDD